jgi:hypothetical protein
MAHCDADHEATAVKTGIVDGKFGNYCSAHLAGTIRTAGAHAAGLHRTQDAQNHRRDMLQPWINGKPNGEFMRAYPEEAAEIFNDKALKSHDRL